MAERSVESSASAVEWPAIVAGALAAMGVTIILFALGTSLWVHWRWPHDDEALVLFSSVAHPGTAAAIGLIVTQWVAPALKRSGLLGGMIASLALVFWGFKRLWRRS